MWYVKHWNALHKESKPATATHSSDGSYRRDVDQKKPDAKMQSVINALRVQKQAKGTFCVRSQDPGYPWECDWEVAQDRLGGS